MQAHGKSRSAGDGTASIEELKGEREYSDPAEDRNSFAAYRGLWIERGLASPDLSDGAFRVLVGIAHFYLNREHRKAFMAATTLATRLGMAPRTVEKHLAELRTRGLIRSIRRGHGRPNDLFPILDPHERADHEDNEPQERADHEPHNSADHNIDDPHNSADHMGAFEGDPHDAAVHEPQERTVKNRKFVRTTTLIEPFDYNTSDVETNLYSDITNENKSPRRSAPGETDLFGEEVNEAATDRKDAPKPEDDIEADFDQFYRTFPKREGRKIALKAYRTARKSADAATILTAAARYAARMDAERREARFIKAPAAWLNGGHFHDDPNPVRQSAKTIDADGNSTDHAPDFSSMSMAEREAFAATLSGTDRVDFIFKTGRFSCR